MSAADFPSGPWTGYYQYPSGDRGTQDLLLQFQDGRMAGMGHDELGRFEVRGTYDEGSHEAQWMKLFPGGHRVSYRGFREGSTPGIWGVWEIPGNWSGGFHIWPVLTAPGNEAQQEEAVPQKVTRPQPAVLSARADGSGV